MNLAIIPARGGSKRIPRKNIRPFRGRPIIAWSIEAALESQLFDEVMVSTDDEEIAQLAASAGASVPFRRSAQTASDHATTLEVIKEVLGRFDQDGRTFERACCIYPTAPFITAGNLREGYQLLTSGRFDVVLPVAGYGYPIWRSLQRDEQGRVAMNWPEHRDARSQDLPPAYHDAGQWYWFELDGLADRASLIDGNSGSVVLPETRVQDIDTEVDWQLAEIKHALAFPALP